MKKKKGWVGWGYGEGPRQVEIGGGTFQWGGQGRPLWWDDIWAETKANEELVCPCRNCVSLVRNYPAASCWAQDRTPSPSLLALSSAPPILYHLLLCWMHWLPLLSSVLQTHFLSPFSLSKGPSPHILAPQMPAHKGDHVITVISPLPVLYIAPSTTWYFSLCVHLPNLECIWIPETCLFHTVCNSFWHIIRHLTSICWANEWWAKAMCLQCIKKDIRA